MTATIGSAIVGFVIGGAPEQPVPSTQPTKETVERGIKIPVMSWPPRMNAAGTAIPFVEQDSAQEVAQCCGFLFSTQPGELIDEPTMGLSDPTFKQGGVSEAALEAVVHRWEPRAILQFERDTLVAVAQAVDIQVESESVGA